jgi:hypothetical protein
MSGGALDGRWHRLLRWVLSATGMPSFDLNIQHFVTPQPQGLTQ